MNLLIVVFLMGSISAMPGIRKRGNPDEWGPYFQGDMRFVTNQTRNGIIDIRRRWPNGTVPYIFDSTFTPSKQTIVLKAMQTYSNLTQNCIQFIPKTTSDIDYVTFVSNDGLGCWSYVGKIGGNQTIHLGGECLVKIGVAQHEMYHALGFHHEQSRPDRDDNVTIALENIQAGKENNFNKYNTNYASVFGVAYDYLSVMHYHAKAFSKNGNYTIVTKDSSFQNKIGQRDGLSSKDLTKLKKMYNCTLSEEGAN